jgi:hypothetical protein
VMKLIGALFPLIHNGMARCVELQSAVRTVAARGGELIDSRGYVCTVM